MQFDYRTKLVTLNDIIYHHKEHEGARRLTQLFFVLTLCAS